LTGAATLSGGTLTNTGIGTANFSLYSSYNNPGNQNGVVISGGSADTIMQIYAPQTGATFSGGGNVYGQAVASSITVNGGTALHYDAAMGGLAKLLSLHEERN